MKKLTFILFLYSMFSCNSGPQIDWMSWEEAENRNIKTDKNGFVWIYTDWCEESQAMMNGLLKHPQVVEYINENFYPIKFHGQSKEDITIKGKTWKFVEADQGNYHDLARALTVTDQFNMNQSIGYPKIAFLDPALNLIVPISGKQNLKDLEGLLAFVGTDSFREMTIEEFMLKHEFVFE